MKIHTVVFWVMILRSLQVGLKCLQVNTFSYPEDSHRILFHTGRYLPNSMNNCIDTLECNAVLQVFVPAYHSGTEKSAPVGIAV
jgi:hypothetical protein